MGTMSVPPTAVEQELAIVKDRMSKIITPESMQKALSFQPRSDDVFLVTTPQSGTTWSQQIIHGLRTGGDMSFDEITMVFPHIEIAHDMGYTDLNAEQVAYPRCYKTHFPYEKTPKGARYIFVCRNPVEVGPSFYNMLGDWTFQKEVLPCDAFVRDMFVNQTDKRIMQQYYHILASWYPHRNDPNVLWYHYEDLKEDMPGVVKMIAQFIGVTDPAAVEIATEQASAEFMKQHATQFDEHPLKLARNQALGLPRDAGMGKGMGKMRVGLLTKPTISQDTVEAIRCRFKEVVGPVTGHDSYEAMRASINKELGRDFAMPHAIGVTNGVSSPFNGK